MERTFSPADKKCLNILILDILKEYTDEEHCLTQQKILDILYQKCGTEYDRRTVAANIESLISLGYDIMHNRDGYFLHERDFEDAELRVLIDSVLFNKNLSHAQADRLIKKLTAQGNKYFPGKVRHICHLNHLHHTGNRQSMIVIDKISAAIAQKRQISFVYNSYGRDMKLHPRREGDYRYIASPYYLVPNTGRYYLVANHSSHDNISHYRVDKITDVKILDDKPAKPLRTLPGYADNYELPRHMAEHVYMFAGRGISITMKIENFMLDTIIDWFGKDLTIIEDTDQHFIISLQCNENAMLYWALQYGQYVEILAPSSLRQKVQAAVKNMCEKYRI